MCQQTLTEMLTTTWSPTIDRSSHFGPNCPIPRHATGLKSPDHSEAMTLQSVPEDSNRRGYMYGGAQNSKLCELDFLVSTDTGMVTSTEAHTKEENS